MDATLDPGKHTLRVTADVTFLCRTNLATLELFLNPQLHIDAVSDFSGSSFTWARSGWVGSARFAVQLVKPCPAGNTVQIHFGYSGTIQPRAPFLSQPDVQVLRDDDLWFPQAGAFDFAESDMTVRAPARSKSLASGELVEQQVEGESAVFHWRTKRPVSSRTLVIYAPPKRASVVEQVSFAAAADKTTPVAQPVRVEEICPEELATPPGAAPCGVLARRAAPIIQHFTAMLGPPPETSLTLLPVFDSGESGLGYSAPGMLLLSDWAARFAGAREYAPGFLAHEIAHQWFPCGVAPASAADGWLAESLAEYLAWRYLLEADPEGARTMVAEAMRDSVAYSPARPLSLGLELLGAPWSAARANLYQRGMLVFRTLETAIDRERVDRALTEFYKSYEGRSASISDFRAVCEEIAGRKLGWFFDYFIQGTEIPTIELRRLPAESPGVVAGEIAVKGLPPEGSVRVEMAIRTAQGLVEHSVATRGAVTPFSVNVPAPALGITLDPDQRILRWTEAAERSKAQTAILAALPVELVTKDLPSAIELLRGALAADPDDASRRAQALHEQLGELEREREEWRSALADLEAAINGHSLSPFDTYLCRAKAYLFHGEVQMKEGRSQEALEDARAGLSLPQFVLMEHFRAGTARENSTQTLQQALESLRDSASHQ